MIARTCDVQLLKAAKRAARKLSDAAPQTNILIASSWGTGTSDHIDPYLIRQVIRSETKLKIAYTDVKGDQSERIIWPLVLIYYADNSMLAAWCELRDGFRHFRLDRITAYTVQPKHFTGQGASLRKIWEDEFKPSTVDTA